MSIQVEWARPALGGERDIYLGPRAYGCSRRSPRMASEKKVIRNCSLYDRGPRETNVQGPFKPRAKALKTRALGRPLCKRMIATIAIRLRPEVPCEKSQKTKTNDTVKWPGGSDDH